MIPTNVGVFNNANNFIQYELNFNATNEDYIDFGTGKAWINDDEFEVEIKISDWEETNSGIFGQLRTNGAIGRWGFFESVGKTKFYYQSASAFLQLETDFVSTGILKATRKSNGDMELLVDDVLKDSGNIIGTGNNSSTRMVINAYNTTDGVTPVPGWYGTGTIHWAKITSFGVINYINLDEGIGNIVTSSEGDVGIIKTSNLYNLNYINQTMWRGIPAGWMNFNSANSDYVTFGRLNWIDYVNPDTVEVSFKTSSTSGKQYAFSQGNRSYYRQRWGIAVNDGDLLIEFYDATRTFTIDLTTQTTVRLELSSLGNFGLEVEIYVDDILLDTIPPNVNTSIAVTDFLVPVLGAWHNDFTDHPSQGSAIQNYQQFLDGIIYWARFNDNYIDINEGVGSTTTGSNLDAGTITTTHPAGIDYINNVMWKDLSNYLLDGSIDCARAYSFRKLKKDAVYSCGIRRSSDDAETNILLDISGGLSLNSLITAGGDLTTWVGANDAYVTTLYDQSGNGLDFTQTDIIRQPKVIDVGSLILSTNGSATIVFDGINDFMSNATPVTYQEGSAFMVSENYGWGMLLTQANPATTTQMFVLITSYPTTAYNSSAVSQMSNGALPFVYGSTDNRNKESIVVISSDSTETFISIDGADEVLEYLNPPDVGHWFGDEQYPLVLGGVQDSTKLYVDFGFEELILYSENKESVKNEIQSNINNFYNIY